MKPETSLWGRNSNGLCKLLIFQLFGCGVVELEVHGWWQTCDVERTSWSWTRRHKRKWIVALRLTAPTWAVWARAAPGPNSVRSFSQVSEVPPKSPMRRPHHMCKMSTAIQVFCASCQKHSAALAVVTYWVGTMKKWEGWDACILSLPFYS